MCEDIKAYEIIKSITDYAAPIITIGSGLLGIFTETKEEIIKTNKSGTHTVKVFTKWAKVSALGILIGGLITIWSIANDSVIKRINKCQDDENNAKVLAAKKIQDSTYNAKVDSVIRLSDSLSRNLLSSIKISETIANTSNENLKLSNKAFENQQTTLLKQDKLLDKSEEILHPFFPFRLRGKYVIKYNELRGPVLDSIFLFQEMIRNNQSTYKKGSVFSEISPLKIGYSVTKEQGKQFGDVAFNIFRKYFEEALCPSMKFFFFDKDLSSNIVDAEASKFYYLASLKYGLSDEYKIDYYFDSEEKFIEIFFEFAVPNDFAFEKKLVSLYSCQNGYLFVDPHAEEFDAKENLVFFEFRCGTGFYDRYQCLIRDCNKKNLKFKNSIGMVFNEERYYYAKIIDLINGEQCR